MTDIQAIKKAAEALMRTLAELRATEPGTVDCENAVGAWRQARRIYMIATGHLQDDPATVLELCRLAEIGREYEREGEGFFTKLPEDFLK